MPSSHTYQLNEIMELVILTNPKNILDIGAGFGKYGVLIYERMNLWWTDNYKNKNVLIDAIEVFKTYLTPIHKFIYNKIYKEDAAKTILKIKKKYDLSLMIDVLEHFSKEEGLKFLNNLKSKSKNILISIPKVVGEQGEAFNNPYEKHRSTWKPEDFVSFGEIAVIPNRFSWIIFFGEEVKNIKQNSFYLKGDK